MPSQYASTTRVVEGIGDAGFRRDQRQVRPGALEGATQVDELGAVEAGPEVTEQTVGVAAAAVAQDVGRRREPGERQRTRDRLERRCSRGPAVAIMRRR